MPDVIKIEDAPDDSGLRGVPDCYPGPSERDRHDHLRREALGFALQALPHGEDSEVIVTTAERFYIFLAGKAR